MMTPQAAAALFGGAFTDAQGLNPWNPERFASWAIALAAAPPDRASPSLVLLAGFVLSFVPPENRSPLERAAAWPSPTDGASLALALASLPDGYRDTLAAWVSNERIAAQIAGSEAALLDMMIDAPALALALGLSHAGSAADGGERFYQAQPQRFEGGALVNAPPAEWIIRRGPTGRLVASHAGRELNAIELVGLVHSIPRNDRAALVRAAAALWPLPPRRPAQ